MTASSYAKQTEKHTSKSQHEKPDKPLLLECREKEEEVMQ
jgi:hypothetical protein